MDERETKLEARGGWSRRKLLAHGAGIFAVLTVDAALGVRQVLAQGEQPGEDGRIRATVVPASNVDRHLVEQQVVADETAERKVEAKKFLGERMNQPDFGGLVTAAVALDPNNQYVRNAVEHMKQRYQESSGKSHCSDPEGMLSGLLAELTGLGDGSTKVLDVFIKLGGSKALDMYFQTVYVWMEYKGKKYLSIFTDARTGHPATSYRADNPRKCKNLNGAEVLSAEDSKKIHLAEVAAWLTGRSFDEVYGGSCCNDDNGRGEPVGVPAKNPVKEGESEAEKAAKAFAEGATQSLNPVFGIVVVGLAALLVLRRSRIA